MYIYKTTPYILYGIYSMQAGHLDIAYV